MFLQTELPSQVRTSWLYFVKLFCTIPFPLFSISVSGGKRSRLRRNADQKGMEMSHRPRRPSASLNTNAKRNTNTKRGEKATIDLFIYTFLFIRGLSVPSTFESLNVLVLCHA